MQNIVFGILFKSFTSSIGNICILFSVMKQLILSLGINICFLPNIKKGVCICVAPLCGMWQFNQSKSICGAPVDGWFGLIKEVYICIATVSICLCDGVQVCTTKVAPHTLQSGLYDKGEG